MGCNVRVCSVCVCGVYVCVCVCVCVRMCSPRFCLNIVVADDNNPVVYAGPAHYDQNEHKRNNGPSMKGRHRALPPAPTPAPNEYTPSQPGVFQFE